MSMRHDPSDRVANTFSKAVAIALDDCLNCLNYCRLLELVKKKLAIFEDRGEIIQLLTIVPCDESISKVAEVFNVSEYTIIHACELRLQKGILSIPEQKKGLASVNKSVVYSHGRKIVSVVNFQRKQGWRNRKNFFCLTFQRFMHSLKGKPLHENWIFNIWIPKWCIPVGAAGTQNTCGFTCHKNVKLMLVTMNSSHNYRQIM